MNDLRKLPSNFLAFGERPRQHATNTRKHSAGSFLCGHGRVRTFPPDRTPARTLVRPMRGTSSGSRFSGTRPATPMSFGGCHDHRRPSKVNRRHARGRKTFSRRSSRGNWPSGIRWCGDWIRIRPGPPGFVTSPSSSPGGCVPGILTSTSNADFWRKRTVLAMCLRNIHGSSPTNGFHLHPTSRTLT